MRRRALFRDCPQVPSVQFPFLLLKCGTEFGLGISNDGIEIVSLEAIPCGTYLGPPKWP